MTPLEKFYTEDPVWHEKIGDIHALLERVKISEEKSGDVLHLRKLSRILSIHASTAIEGNRLTLEQVTAVINGNRELLALSIAPEVISSENPELLENLIISAINLALENAREMVNQEMSKVTGGFSIPGLM